MVKMSRPTHIAEKIIFVDGLAGSGKTMLGPVLSSLKGVEKAKAEHIYEYLCVLYYFRKIELDAAVSLMRLFADLAIYNSLISRDLNFRPFDTYGLLNDPRPLKYISQLFYKDGDIVLERIKKNSPILQLSTHHILPAIDLAFNSYGKRLRIVEMIRHPLYIIRHWFDYMERYGTDPREFTLWLDYNGKNFPWFTFRWEEEYLKMATIDKVIYSIKWFIEQGDIVYQKLSDEQKKQILFIPFEKFVTDPWPFMKQLEIFLGTEITSISKKVLKRQKCPRSCFSAGRGHKRYGWRKTAGNIDNLTDYREKKDFVLKKVSESTLKIFNRLSTQYEQEHNIF